MSDMHEPFTLSPRTRAMLSRDFTWGVATSAYQIEGGAAAGGRGPSIWDTFSHTPGKTRRGETGDVACDHYHRWPEDVAMMASLGVDAYRFSISWSRVQPLGHGAWNETGLAFYDRLVDALLAKGLRPHATLYHWDLPQGLQDVGGWASRETTLRFAEYAERIARRLGDRLAGIATHNEPWCTAVLGHERGQFAPGFKDPALAADVSHHLLLSHGLALQAMRGAGCKAPLGIVLNQSSSSAATDSAADHALAATEYASFVRWYMEPIFSGGYPRDPGIRHYPRNIQPGDFAIIGQPLDFLGVNYYTRIWASAATPPLPAPRALGVTDMGWEIHPEGLTELLVDLHRRYPGLPPISVMENGMANAGDSVVDGRVADPARIDYMRRHLEAIARAREAGVDIRGFFYWSLMDNYEWDSGYDKRFGLVHVDYATQLRTLKDSALWYRETIASQRKESGHG
jgi:beta-glucosidase